ncbi:MAG: ABC transporter permease [Chloroflexi bacterium]|nr:ABC transporter permease [Chloroflexota bacterium]
MGMYILRRLALVIPILFFMSIVTFALWNLAPGDPIDSLINPEELEKLGQYPDLLKDLRQAYGLDKPIWERYLIWLREALQGNLGYSFVRHIPVVEVLGERIAPTLRLTLAAMAISLLLGIPLGVVSAVRQYSLLDYILTFLVFIWNSVPGFFIALSMVYIFSIRLKWFPAIGMNTTGAPPSLWDDLRHLILPATALGLEGVASLLRYTRNSLLDVLRQEYVTMARAKGLSESVVLLRHALRNALLPVVTILGLRIPSLFGGALLIEVIFNWPGMGRLSIQAMQQQDYNLILGSLLFFGTLTLVANLVTDIAYAYVDPRIRYDEA